MERAHRSHGYTSGTPSANKCEINECLLKKKELFVVVVVVKQAGNALEFIFVFDNFYYCYSNC